MFRSVAQQLTGSLVCAAISFALMIYLGRTLGADDFGRYVAILSIAVVALPLIEGGWPPLLYRSAVIIDSSPQDAHAAGHSIAHALLVCVGLTALAAIVAWATRWAAPATAAASIACMGAVAVANFVSARMRGAGRFGLEAMWRVAGRLVSAAAIVLVLLAAGVSVAGIFLAWTIGLLLVLAVGARGWIASPRWNGLLKAYPLLLPLLMLEWFFAVLFRGDVAIAAAAGLAREPLSFYAACGRLVEACLLLFAPFVIVLLRNLRLSSTEPANFASQLQWAVAIAVVCGGTAWLIAIVVGETLVPALFGAEFEPAGRLLPWVMSCLPLAFANQVWVQAIVALRRERTLPLRLAMAALFAVAAIALGAHLDAARGAAIGFTSGQALLALLLVPLARVQLP